MPDRVQIGHSRKSFVQSHTFDYYYTFSKTIITIGTNA